MSLNRAPFVGAIKYIVNRSFPIPQERDVISQDLTKRLVHDLLISALKKVIKNKGDEVLPTNIAIFRSGGGDGLLRTIISKEVAGIKQEINDFKKTQRDLIKKAHGSYEWYPSITYTVI